jgi:hypothetical protein
MTGGYADAGFLLPNHLYFIPSGPRVSGEPD